MRKLLQFIPIALISTVLLGVIIAAYFDLPSGFVELPKHLHSFNDLIIRETVDTIRYLYSGAVYGVVYGVMNCITKQIYIGSTRVPAKRFYEHLVSGTNSNPILQNSIMKYSLEVFKFIIFEVINISLLIAKSAVV